MRFGSIALVAFAWVVLGACASDRTASGLNVDGGGFPKPLDGSNADSSHTGVGCAAAAKWVYLVAADRTFIRFEPQTLWRPPEAGSSAEAASDNKVSKTGVSPGNCRARCIMNAPLR